MRSLLLVVATLTFGACLHAQADTAAEDFAFGAGLHDRGLHDRAVRAFETYLERWPRDARVPKAQFHCAQSLAALGRDEDALARFEHYLATKDVTLRGEATLRAGEIEQRLGRSAAAAKRLAALIATPNLGALEEPALYFLGEALSGSGDPVGAASAYERLVAKYAAGPYGLPSRSALGFLAFAAGKHALARTHFDAVAKSASEDRELVLEANVLLIECDLIEGKPEVALSRIEPLRQEKGRLAPQIALARARALLDLKRADDATKAFQRLQKDYPDEPRLPRALLRAAADLEAQGRGAAGLDLLAAVKPATPEDTKDLAYWKGRLLSSTGKVEESLEPLRQAANTSPRRKFAYGDALARAGRHEDAAKIFNELERTDDARLRQEAAFAEAYSRQRLGQGERAVGLLEALSRQELAGDLSPDVTFALAENLFALKRYDEASRAYDRLLSAEPGLHRPAAQHKRGWCAWLTRDLEAAEQAFTAVLGTKADAETKAEARYLIGKVLEAKGRHEEARRVFAQLAADPAATDLQPKAVLGEAAALARLGKHDEAEVLFRSLLKSKLAPDLRGLLLTGLGDAQLRLGKPVDAIASYTKFLTEHPNDPRAASALLGRAWAHRANGDPTRAAVDAAAVAEGTDSGLQRDALHLAGLALHEAGRPAEAIAVLRRFAAISGDHPRRLEVELLLGLTLARTNEPDAALKHFSTVIAADPNTPGHDTALYEAAFCHEAKNRTDERDRCSGRLIELHPKSALAPDAAFRLGNAAYDSSRDEDALARYRFVIESKDPALSDKARYKAGWALSRLRRPREAASTFDLVAAGSSELAAESLYLAGNAWEEAEEWAEALARFQRLVESNSRHELAGDAACRGALLLGRLQRTDELIAVAPTLLARCEKEPRAIKVALALGHAFRTKKQWEPARAAFRRVTKASEGPSAAESQYQIGLTHLAEGDKDRALDELLRVSILYGHQEWVAKATLASAKILESQGEREKARRLLEELVKNHPQTEEGREAAVKLRSRPSE